MRLTPKRPDGNGRKRKQQLRFQFSRNQFPDSFQIYLGGNEKSSLVSILVSARFLFPSYRREMGNENRRAVK